MPIAIDASSPAGVTNTGLTATTASFTPPALSLLVAVTSTGSPAHSVPSNAVGDSIGSTWTPKASVAAIGKPVIWIMDAGASPAARTVHVTGNVSGALIKVIVLTGAAVAALQTASVSNIWSSKTLSSISFAPVQLGSLVVVSTLNVFEHDTLTASGVNTLDVSLNDATNNATYGATHSSLVASLTSTLFGCATTYSTANGAGAAFELFPAPVAFTPRYYDPGMSQAVNRAANFMERVRGLWQPPRRLIAPPKRLAVPGFIYG